MSADTDRFAARRQVTALSLDVVSIVVFAAVGRRSHDESRGLGSVLSTAAPFLVALLVGWGATKVLSRRRSHLRDGADRDAGVVIWIVTVGLGLVLRRTLWDRGMAFAFVVVATLVLGVFIVGRRIALGLLEDRRNHL